MRFLKEHIKTVLKLIFGGGLVYYVLRSNMIDFQALQEVVWNPINLLLSFSFFTFSALCISTRWYFLARAQGLSLSFKDVVALTMIGNFFNMFMPGAVGGDLIKAWYVAGKEPTRKTKAIFTVLLDRVIGLSVIVFYAAVTALVYFGLMNSRRELQLVGYSVWGFTTMSILFGVCFFSPKIWGLAVVQACLEFIRKFGPLSKILDAALLYQKHLGTVVVAILISFLAISSVILLWSIQGPYLGVELEVPYYFFIVPLGLTASAIPLLPGGIGVGQVAFYTLFLWMGASNPEQGGTLCTLMQVHLIMFSCTGSLFYIRYKRNPKFQETDSANSSMTVGTSRTSLS